VAQRLLRATAAADRPAGEAERRAEAAADPAAEGGDGEVALPRSHRVDKGRQPRRGGAEVAVAEQEWRRVGAPGALDHRVGGGGHVAALAVRPAAADHLRARPHRGLRGAVPGGVVRDDDLRPGEGPGKGLDRGADPVRLVARGDEDDGGRVL